MFRLLEFVLALVLAAPAQAHPAPFSYMDLRYEEGALEGTLTLHELDLMHELRIDSPAELRDPHHLIHRMEEIGALLAGRMRIEGNEPLKIEWTYAEPLKGHDAVRLYFRVVGPRGGSLTYDSNLFPYDPQHQTFVNIYEGDGLAQQWIVSATSEPQVFYRGNAAGALSVLGTFVPSGIRHILIGPDHILFLVGLLLFGGTARRLVAIVTAFTVGHSITLSLAALDLVTPPGWLVEPAIALTIVIVGADNLLRGEGKDLRMWLAGVFGLIHGFGFASVLREFGLPPEALGWSLFGFNVGVELGQLALVVPLAFILGALWRRREKLARQIATAGSIVVIAGGSYWFVERVFFPGGIL
jgi:hydrogenase/urease accessory protein HupE